jgi:hypothetical protein
VTDVDVPVRVWGAVVEDELAVPPAAGDQLSVDVLPRPLLEEGGLALRQVAAHREFGLR